MGQFLFVNVIHVCRPKTPTAACGNSRWITVFVLVVEAQETATDMTVNTSLLI